MTNTGTDPAVVLTFAGFVATVRRSASGRGWRWASHRQGFDTPRTEGLARSESGALAAALRWIRREDRRARGEIK